MTLSEALGQATTRKVISIFRAAGTMDEVLIKLQYAIDPSVLTDTGWSHEKLLKRKGAK